ncbi:hypothetical protein [Propioniciclava sp.]|uniref:hypothetical protein n=1 Tax=Propioniciclava sp. TaxID=2038686 RepID=UPI00260E9E1A|nr:hypothetical protein [Propioniciclava sp.]
MLLRSATESGRRTLTFRLPGDHGHVSVCGTFNDWTPEVLVMEHAADGWLEASVEVPSAEPVIFRYRGENDWWFDELDADDITGEGSVVAPDPTDKPRTAAEVAAVKEARLRKKRVKVTQEAEKRRRDIEKRHIEAEKKAAKKAAEAEEYARKVARKAEKAATEARRAVAKAAKKAQKAKLAHRLEAQRRAEAGRQAAAAAREARQAQAAASEPLSVASEPQNEEPASGDA